MSISPDGHAKCEVGVRQTGKVGTHEPLVLPLLPRACGLMDDPWKSRSRCQRPTSQTRPPSENTGSGRTPKT
eukprot:scaffold78654_cov51-Phaeocystis_antarctica.AAC.2